MRETNTGMTEYLEFYNTAWDDLMTWEARPASTLREYGNRSVRTTWAISFEGVKRKNEDAAKLLQVWSYLDNRDIWFGMFNNERNSDLEAWSNPPEWFRRVVRNKLSFKGVAATLLAYSLIEARQDSESYGVHPVVHEWCRKTVPPDRPELAFLAITSVAFGVPDSNERGSWPIRRRLLQHANRFSQPLLDMLEEALEFEQAPDLYNAFWGLGGLYQDGGPRMWIEAEATYSRAVSGFEKYLGLHHEITLHALANLATLYNDQERFIDAEALNRRVLAIRREVLGLDHIDTTGTMLNLAIVLTLNDKLAEAESLYQHLLMRAPMEVESVKSRVFAGLGNIYCRQGKRTESEAMYLQAIAGYKTELETDHPDLLNVRYSLGFLYEQENRLVEADATMHQVSEGMKKVFGLEHEETLNAMHLLGTVFRKQEKFAEAEAVYQQALAGRRTVCGPEHESTLRTLRNLAICYTEQNKFTQVEALLLQELQSFKSIPDGQKTSTQLDCIHDLGYIYLKLGRLAEGEVMYQ